MRKPVRVHPLLPLALVTALLAAAPCLAGGIIDLELQNRTVVKGRIDTGREVETYRLFVPDGARLHVTLKGRGARPPTAGMKLMDEAGQELVLSPAVRSIRGGVKLEDFPVPAEGTYQIDVRSADGGTGNSVLRAHWSFDSVFTGDVVVQGTAGTLAFSGEAGTKASYSVKCLEPGTTVQLVELDEPDGATTPLTAPKRLRRSHKLRKRILPKTGHYTLHFRTSAPNVTVRAKVKVGSKRFRKLDTRGFDRPNRKKGKGGKGVPPARRFIERAIGASGRAVDVPHLDLDQFVQVDSSGTKVDVPGSAVSFPSNAAGTLCVASDANDAVLSSLQTSPASNLVEFAILDENGDPAPLKAGGLATIDLPIDVGAFSFGAEFELGQEDSELLVLHEPTDGDPTAFIPPSAYTVDLEAGKVSFPTSSFSSFQVVAPEMKADVLANVVGPNDLSVPPDSEALYIATDDLDPDPTSSSRTPGVLVQNAAGGQIERFAGGGTDTADYTQRLDFDFDDDVFSDAVISAVHAAPQGEVVVVASDLTRTRSAVYLIHTDGRVLRVAGDGGDPDGYREAAARTTALPFCTGATMSPDGGVIYVVTDFYPAFESDIVIAIELDPNPADIRLTTVVGKNGTKSTSGQPPQETRLFKPRSILADAQGRLLVGDFDWLLRFDLDANTGERLAGTNFDENGDPTKSADEVRELGGQGAPLQTVVTGRLEDLAFDRLSEDIVYAADFNSGIIWRFDLKRDRAYVAAGRRMSLDENILTRLDRTTEEDSDDHVEFPLAVAPRADGFYVGDHPDQLIVFQPR